MEDISSSGRVLMLRDRRSDHDITNTVLVTHWEPVWDVVQASFTKLYPGMPLRIVRQAFEDSTTCFAAVCPATWAATPSTTTSSTPST
jgi:hypothetical protein